MEYHDPVMPMEILEYMITNPEGCYLDGTMGGGGHSELIARMVPHGQLISLDRDPDAIAFATRRLAEYPQVTIHHTEFANMADFVAPNSVDGILLDLGVSSHQLDEEGRGFSFRLSETVDLRMNQSSGEDARSWLLANEVRDIAQALRINADIRKMTSWLATALKNLAKEGELLMQDILRLAERIQPKDKKAGAARILQALRMEVNDEMGQLKNALKSALSVLKPNGRLCILTYHSVEDRIVKEVMRDWERDCLCPVEQPICSCGGQNKKMIRLFKKPLPPTEQEMERNPRARSAKLRVGVKC